MLIVKGICSHGVGLDSSMVICFEILWDEDQIVRAVRDICTSSWDIVLSDIKISVLGTQVSGQGGQRKFKGVGF